MYTFFAIGASGLLLGLCAFAYAIVCYVFTGIGFYNLAKKYNDDKAFLAWIPFANSYIIGHYGFEVYGDKSKAYFKWILLGCACGTVLPAIGSLCIIGNVVFLIFAYINIFKALAPDNVTGYTVAGAFGLGGIFVKNNLNNVNPTKKEQKFCSYCGKAINKDSKFCSYCGKGKEN